MTVPGVSNEELANRALGAFGQKAIASLSPPTTEIEKLVQRHFVATRRRVLRKYTIWNFAKVESTISLAYTTTQVGAQNPASITGITQANPGVVTAPAHGFTNGQLISITGVVGMTQINNTGTDSYSVNVIDLNTFTLTFNGSLLNTVGFGAYVSNGICTPTQSTPLWPGGKSDFINFYTLPSDMVRFLSAGGTAEEFQIPARWYDLRGKYLCTRSGFDNNPQPDPIGPTSVVIRYIQDVEDLSMWEDGALTVFELELAVKLAFALTKDQKIVAMLNELLKAEIPDAASVSSQEKPPLRIQRSKIIEGRLSGGVTDPRYYPFSGRDFGY